MQDLSVEELREIVIQSFKSGGLRKSQLACQELHRRFPEDLGIQLNLAEIAEKGGDEGWAIQLYEDVAENFTNEGLFINAIGIYKKIMEIDPSLTTPSQKIEDICALQAAKESPKEDDQTGRPSLPFLTELEKEDLLPLVESFKRLTYPMGSIIWREGDEGRFINIISRGKVRIFIEGVVGEKIEVAQLKDGDFFGETGFFTDGKRHASVMALDDTDILQMTRTDVEMLTKEHPRIMDVLDYHFRKSVV